MIIISTVIFNNESYDTYFHNKIYDKYSNNKTYNNYSHQLFSLIKFIIHNTIMNYMVFVLIIKYDKYL